MKSALELAAEDLVAGERAKRSDRSRAGELLAVLDQVRRRDHRGVAGLVFFEFDELPERGVPEATPLPSIVRPAANTDADSGSAEPKTSDPRATGTG